MSHSSQTGGHIVHDVIIGKTPSIMTFILTNIDPVIFTQKCCGKNIIMPGPECKYVYFPVVSCTLNIYFQSSIYTWALYLTIGDI